MAEITNTNKYNSSIVTSSVVEIVNALSITGDAGNVVGLLAVRGGDE